MTHRAPELHTTEDGSLTLYAPTFGEHYHSMHGAVQESEHIYLGLALRERMDSWQEGDAPLRLFEVGFGTGLNALLSWREAEERHIPLRYYSIEKFPITPEVYEALHYEGLGEEREVKDQLLRLHTAPWDEAAELSPFFTLHKLRGDLTTCTFPRDLSVIYYDAFSPESQPELWAEELFQRLGKVACSGAILSTYCAKGEVRRRLQRSGFLVERLPGPPGKREVLRGRIP
nr:tRNA (5-methylaminomethyl-2-thiouridine)(34)-methyltransferase MnmD [uncultured Porphyromonas sp.]